MSNTTAQTAAAPPLETPPSLPEDDKSWETIAHVEVDRFCEKCGYNLYTRPVVRHPQLELLVVRCPDCGQYHAARDTSSALAVWGRRLSIPLLGLWISAILSLMFFTGLGEVAITMVTVEEGSRHTRREFVMPDGQTVERWVLVRDEDFPRNLEDVWMIRALRGSTAGMGFVATAFAALAFPHWRKWGYLIWMGILVSIPLAIIYTAFQYEMISMEMRSWGWGYALSYAAWFAGASLVAIVIARPLTRGLLRLFLTPKMCQPFAWLWIADRRIPPRISST